MVVFKITIGTVINWQLKDEVEWNSILKIEFRFHPFIWNGLNVFGISAFSNGKYQNMQQHICQSLSFKFSIHNPFSLHFIDCENLRYIWFNRRSEQAHHWLYQLNICQLNNHSNRKKLQIKRKDCIPIFIRLHLIFLALTSSLSFPRTNQMEQCVCRCSVAFKILKWF